MTITVLKIGEDQFEVIREDGSVIANLSAASTAELVEVNLDEFLDSFSDGSTEVDFEEDENLDEEDEDNAA